jgi:AcrR family transcriptional regulator
MTTTSPGRTPRERARAELTREIKDAARRQLAHHGAAGLSMRAIANDVGLLSASALYRYFPGRDALLTALIVDGYAAMGEAAEAAEALVHTKTVMARWLAICHGVRAWSLANPHEYGLIFGSPIPGYVAPGDTVASAARVPVLLTALLEDLAAIGFDARNHGAPPAAVRRAMRPVLALAPSDLPSDLVIAGFMAWTYLVGALSLEVFGHRDAMHDDATAYFDYEMRRIATNLGLAGQPVPTPNTRR